VNDEFMHWQKLVDDMNKDTGYAGGYEAGLERSRLEEQWKRDRPGKPMPFIQWSRRAGKNVVVTGLLGAEEYSKRTAAIHAQLQAIADQTRLLARTMRAHPGDAEWVGLMDQQDRLLGQLEALDVQMGF
jgi:hypothetical protein